MQMIAGKYVPPHMRNRPATAAAPPSEHKFNQKTKKTKKTKKVEAVQKPAAQEVPKVKPHCELFLADLPAPMRSVTTLAGRTTERVYLHAVLPDQQDSGSYAQEQTGSILLIRGALGG
jgi:hypothetical protein